MTARTNVKYVVTLGSLGREQNFKSMNLSKNTEPKIEGGIYLQSKSKKKKRPPYFFALQSIDDGASSKPR